MICSHRLLRSTILGLGAALVLAGAAAAAGFQRESAASPPAQGPVAHVAQYTPLPAAWNAPITIHGSHLKPPPVPTRTAVDEPAQPLRLAFASLGKGGGFVPEQDILSWTETQIQLRGLSAPAGVYLIAILRGDEVLSNLNQTLLLAEGDPDATLGSFEEEAPGRAILAGPDDETGADGVVAIHIAKALAGSMGSHGGNRVGLEPADPLERDGPDLVEPSVVQNAVAGYQPELVGQGDDITVLGYFPPLPNRVLAYGVLGQIGGVIPPAAVKSWGANQIQIAAGVVPMGVWWIAVFAQDGPQAQLVSNLKVGLQVTEGLPQVDPVELRWAGSPGGGSPGDGGRIRLEKSPLGSIGVRGSGGSIAETRKGLPLAAGGGGEPDEDGGPDEEAERTRALGPPTLVPIGERQRLEPVPPATWSVRPIDPRSADPSR